MNTTHFFEQFDKDAFKKYINDTVIRAQHCQRNWDLSREIPQEDMNLMIHAATECPSKQNMDFYDLYVVQNREIQEKIYESSTTASGKRKNPQLLANALFVFVEKIPTKYRNLETKSYWGDKEHTKWQSVVRQQHQAVGVAAGFLNTVATLLGYSTGCNTCQDNQLTGKLLKTNGQPALLSMGIGFKDGDRNRREEMITGQMIGTFKKCPINIVHVK